MSSTWHERPRALDRLGTQRFDLLVIGGGITGAGVARDAATRGLRVALVEAADFGSGTSSRSSRLVHGGVRYLEHGYLGLVFEASRERERLLRLAPHLVRPLAFTWPVYEGARLPRWKLGAGLWLYDLLAQFRNVGRHQGLSAEGVLRHEPRLAREGLTGGARYWDAATDDSRLTLANVVAAAESEATVVNHCAVQALVHSGGRTAGAVVLDRLGGTERTVRADLVVNAAGPWADEILALDTAGAAPAVRGTKGVHVLVPRERVGNVDAVTLVSAVDGRVMFVLPAGRFALLGTTDTPTDEHPGDVRATPDDVGYVLRSVNAAFPEAGLTPDDVVSTWAGLRPLAAARRAGEGAASASREHALTWSASRMLTVSGGKLTTYRAMAEEIVDAVVRELHRRAKRPLTDRLPLPGGDIASLGQEIAVAARITGDVDVAERLAGAHGSRWRRVWALAEQERALRERLVPSLPYLAAEVVYAATRELACTVGDALIRRLPLAFETRDHGCGVAARVAELMAPRLGWDAETRRKRIAGYRIEVERLFG